MASRCSFVFKPRRVSSVPTSLVQARVIDGATASGGPPASARAAMVNGDEWEDISDGGDDDWETGKPVAPRSGSGSGLSGSGSNGSVGTAPPSRHRPQSSWGADDDDWGGDEEDWRPAPVRPSPSNARGARARSPPRSPALTKGVSPARPAKGTRRWTRSRAACKRLGVLVCLVAAAVTLSSFGIFEGGGSGRGDEPWETRPGPFSSSDALERSARPFGDRPTADSSADRFATAVGERDGTRVGDSVSTDARVAPAPRAPAEVEVQRAVVVRTPIATIGSGVSVSRRAADEIARLKASHEHVSNAADANRFPRRAGPAEDDVAVEVEKKIRALGRLGTEPDVFSGPISTDLEADAVRLGSIATAGTTDDDDDAKDGSHETASSSDETNNVIVGVAAKEEEDDEKKNDDSVSVSVFGEVTDVSHDALLTVDRSDDDEARLSEDVFARDDAETSATKEESHEEAPIEMIFGEVVDAADPESGASARDDGVGGDVDVDVDDTVSAQSFAPSGDVLEETFISNDGDIAASSGDGEEDGEEDDASFVDEKAFGSDSDSDSDSRDAALVPDADEEEDASRATDDSSRFRSKEGSEEASEEASQEASEESFADAEEEALLSSETRPVVSEDEASSAISAAEKNTPAAENNDDSPPPPPPPPRPPPVPMDGPDMTDPANRAALDAYQSREKYVAWSKKAAKLEGRVVAPTRAVAR